MSRNITRDSKRPFTSLRWFVRSRTQGHRCDRRKNGQRQARVRTTGMTLLEVLIVLALISLVAASIGAMVYKHHRRAQDRIARLQVRELASAAMQFMIDNDYRCPADAAELVKQGFYKNGRDPWGKPMRLQCPGEHDTEGVDVVSLGPDRIADSADDIRSWELDAGHESTDPAPRANH